MAAPISARALVSVRNGFWRFSGTIGTVPFVRNASKTPATAVEFAEDASSPSEQKKLYTDDGIMKRSGVLINKTLSSDGKPVYPGKYKRLKMAAGTVVRAGMMLVQQKRLDLLPGLYVGLGRDLTLYAYEDGIVCVTCEKVAFDWNRNLVRRFFFDQRDLSCTYKVYYHVIPKPQHNRFKLVSQT